MEDYFFDNVEVENVAVSVLVLGNRRPSSAHGSEADRANPTAFAFEVHAAGKTNAVQNTSVMTAALLVFAAVEVVREKHRLRGASDGCEIDSALGFSKSLSAFEKRGTASSSALRPFCDRFDFLYSNYQASFSILETCRL